MALQYLSGALSRNFVFIEIIRHTQINIYTYIMFSLMVQNIMYIVVTVLYRVDKLVY